MKIWGLVLLGMLTLIAPDVLYPMIVGSGGLPDYVRVVCYTVGVLLLQTATFWEMLRSSPDGYRLTHTSSRPDSSDTNATHSPLGEKAGARSFAEVIWNGTGTRSPSIGNM